jgi:hypothetical protein
MSPDKKIWRWGGAGLPAPASWDIEDDSNKEAFINLIDEAELSDVCAGSVGNQFFFSVGNVTYRGTTYTNAVLRGLMNQDASYILWSIDTYPVRPIIFAQTVIDNERVLTFGTEGVDDVYIMENGTNDGATAIDGRSRTAFLNFGDPFSEKEVSQLIIEYKPQTADNTYLTIRYAINGSTTYTDVSSPDAGTPITAYGVIDMYESDAATDFQENRPLGFPQGLKFKNISIEVGNSQSSESFEITRIGFRISTNPATLIPEALPA